MKVYFEISSKIRVRFTQDEFERLCQGSILTETFSWWGDSAWSLEVCENPSLSEANQFEIQSSVSLVQLSLSPKVLLLLQKPSKSGVSLGSQSARQAWRLTVEVDLKK